MREGFDGAGSREHERGAGFDAGEERRNTSAAPGRRTLVDGLAAPAVSSTKPAGTGPIELPAGLGAAGASPYTDATGEFRGFGADFGAGDMAAAGVGGRPEPIPHLQAVQASFGRHDVSHARGHLDAAAGASSAGLGAEAYAVGADVAFGSRTPSLHTVAHELAHVVQQQPGVSRKAPGVAGLDHESHANAVADAVVAGRSAEPLLDAGPSASVGVQRKATRIDFTKAEAAAPPGPDEEEPPYAGFLWAPPQKIAPASASELLAGFVLRPAPHGYMWRTRADNEYSADRPEGRVGAASAEPAYTESHAKFVQLRDSHRAIREMNHGRTLADVSARDMATADKLTDDNRPEGRQVTEDIGDLRFTHSTVVNEMPHRLMAGTSAISAAMHMQQAVEAEIDRLHAQESARKQAAKLKGLEAERDRTVRKMRGLFGFVGKLLKFSAKLTSPEKILEGMGEMFEGVGGLIGDWVVTGINKSEIAAAKAALKGLEREIQELGEQALLNKWRSWKDAVAEEVHKMLAEVAALDGLVEMRRSRFATLGKSVNAATAGKLGKDRRLGDQIRQVPLLEDFIRLAGTLPLDQLRSVDNPLLVKDNPGDRSFAFWARDHLPQLADVVEALKAHYERQREDAMHLISVMDK